MGIVAKQSVWNSVILFTGAFLGALNTVILFPKMLEQSEIGLTGMLSNLAIIAAQVSAFGMPSVLVRYIPKYRNNKGENGGVLRFVLLLAIIGAVIVSLALFFGRDIFLGWYSKGAEQFSKYYFLVIPLLIFTVLTTVLNNYYKSILRSIFQNFMQEIFIRICKTAVLIVYFFDWISFDQFILYFVLISGVSILILVIYLLIIGEFNLSKSESSKSIKDRGEMIIYGL
ncbi:MAG: hypothetical protein R3255_08335, partial [Candidatus Lokiarchaeia archaeon]|nr:hypothetical protein [Candidatus Lokiarchaeia archaeon]